jgi:hypothetical protein
MNKDAMTEKNTQGKVPYVAPRLEVFEYTVEQGYAATNLKMRNREEVSEITDSTGQNYHGEWF